MKNNEKEQSRKLKKELHIRLSNEEYSALQKWQGWLGMSTMNDVIRTFIRSGVGYKFDYSEHSHYAVELSRIGNNINQIAYRVNAISNVYQSDIDMIKEYQLQIEENLREFLKAKEHCERTIGRIFLENAGGNEEYGNY